MLTSLLSPEIKMWFEKSAASELYASHLYQYMANQMQRIGMFGAQSFFLKESREELGHYQKLVDFVNDCGDVLGVPAVGLIQEQVGNISLALQTAYQTELALMDQYEEFYEYAEENKDCVTATFLIEFLQEQRKSTGAYGDLIARLNLNPSDLFEFDEYLKEK